MRALVDWCSCTFALSQCPGGSPALVRELSRVLGLQIVGTERRVLPGFKEGVLLLAMVRAQLVPLAVLSWGGESQKGRALLQFSGEGCQCVRDWAGLRDLLASLPDSRLTRVDLAVDMHDGFFAVSHALEWLSQGLFKFSGKKEPKSQFIDDMGSDAGKTLYVGKSKNGKGLRVYEKGKQLGDVDSAWTRFEVQFGNRDRELPFDILTDGDRYFTGAYPALQKVLDEAPERIRTVTAQGAVTLGHLVAHMKRSYGKVMNLLALDGIEAERLIEGFRVRMHPRRIPSAAVVEDVLRPAIEALFPKPKALP